MSMDTMTDPKNRTDNHHGDSGPELETSRARLDELKAQKGRLSRQIGEAKRAGEPAEALIAELKAVSDTLKELQKRRKKAQQAEAGNGPKEERPEPSAPAFYRAPGEPDVTIKDIAADPREASLMAKWDQYVSSHPAASPYHLMCIRHFIEATYGHTTRYLWARGPDNEILGVLPLVQLRSRLFGNFVVSVPYFNYGGVLADTPEVARALVTEAGRWARFINASHVEMRHLGEDQLDLPARTDKVTFWLNLPKDPDTLWQSFRPKVRAQIRRGEKEEPHCRIGGVELLDDFYEVFAENMRDLGTPVYSKAFFRNLLGAGGIRTWLVVVNLGGKPCGCAFLLGHGDRMEIPWASTLRRYNPTGLNMFMYWRILVLAMEQGYKQFDFGRCSEDAGTYRFKQQWGAQPVPMRWDYQLSPGAELPGLNPDNPKFQLLIAAWQRMPVWLSRLIGPHIVKSLP